MNQTLATLVDAAVVSHASRLPLDEAAFADLYARTSAPLLRYLRRLLGYGPLAEDLVQETYLRFLSQARIPEDDDHRRNYLYKIATNLARDHFRRAKHAERSLDPEHAARVADPSPEHRPGMPESFDVWSALERVTPRDRELLLLAYVEGLTHREISQVTGLMRASLKPLLFRARRRFALVLNEAGLAPEFGTETSS